MAFKKGTPKGVDNPRVDSLTLPKCAAARQDIPAAEAPIQTSPRSLSDLLQPCDFEGYDEEQGAHSVLSEEVYNDAYRLAYGRLKREMKVVYNEADIHDVLMLTKALKYWRKYHGGDRVQAGNLMSSILCTMGVTHLNPIRVENNKKHIAMLRAKDRLKGAGVRFVDDSPEVYKADEKVEGEEDKRLRKMRSATIAEARVSK